MCQNAETECYPFRNPQPVKLAEKRGDALRTPDCIITIIIVNIVGRTVSRCTDLSAAATLQEYCQWEKFNASCPGNDNVILMLSGRYGRMRFGRCMREDHGSVGCSADVLSYLDRQCSGRRRCQLQVPDAVLHAMHRCPKEIMSYLEASYVCVTGQLLRLLKE